MSRLRQYLFGRTRVQKFLRIGAAAIFVVVVVLMAWVAWGGGTPLILPVLVLLVLIWAVLVILDLREGLRDIANREP